MNPSMNVNWTPGVTLEEMERQTILCAMHFYQGNKTQTAIALGVSVRTIDAKMEKYEQDRVSHQERVRLEREKDLAILNRMRGVTPYIDTKTQGQGVLGTNSGLYVEPAAHVPAQQPVPMPQRSEVQAVLPRQVATGGNGKRR